MGYTTDFDGSFQIAPALTAKDQSWLARITGYENRHESKGSPSYYCQWEATSPSELEWDGNEKFYAYIEWLEYLIEKFFKPRGYSLNGVVTWSGEDSGDTGVIGVKANVIKVKKFVPPTLDELFGKDED